LGSACAFFASLQAMGSKRKMIEGAEGAGLAGDIHYGSDPSGCGQKPHLKDAAV